MVHFGSSSTQHYGLRIRGAALAVGNSIGEVRASCAPDLVLCNSLGRLSYLTNQVTSPKFENGNSCDGRRELLIEYYIHRSA